jgi:hypothetical protein
MFLLSINSYTLNAGVQIFYMLAVDNDQLSALRLSAQTRFEGHCSRTYGTFAFQTTCSCHVTVPLVGVSMFIVICVCDGGVEARGSYIL